jgi:DNA-binding ferritin-like protein (Dps family)
MAPKWIEKVTGSLEQKRSYREYKARVGRLPAGYHDAVRALERYFMYFGGISDGETLVTMFGDLADLFERAAADGTPIRDLVGEDPVEFADAFLQNYAQGQWINKERVRLVAAIDRAAEEGSGSGTGTP